METDVYDRDVLAKRYPEFADFFMQGDIRVLKDGNKRIIRFPNTYPSIFRPKLSFVMRLMNDFFPEYKYDQMELNGCFLTGAEIIIDISPPPKGQE